MQVLNVEQFTEEEVRANIERAILIADDHASADASVWETIFRAAYDGLASRQTIPVPDSPISLGGILTNGRG